MVNIKSLLSKTPKLLLFGIVLFSFTSPFLLKADVDTTKPEIAYGHLTPLSGTEVSGVLTVDGNFNDIGGLSSVLMGLDGNWVCTFTNPASGYKTCNIDTTTFENGTYPVSYWAEDLSGNQTYFDTRSITINNHVVNPGDTTAPIFAMQNITVEEGTNPPSGFAYVANNPENLHPTCTTTLTAADLIVSQPNLNKVILVSCYVEDAAGNRTTASSNLYVNNSQPGVVIIAAPSVDVAAGSSVVLTANILGGNAGFTYYWTGACSGSGSISANGLTSSTTLTAPQGTYLCGINVTDKDGDIAAASVKITVAGSSTSTTSPSTTPTPSTSTEENQDTETPAAVEGENTSDVSAPEESTKPIENSTNTTNNTPNSVNPSVETPASTTTSSPVIIICLVAGGILIIGLLLFLFFKGDEEEEEVAAV